MAQHTPGPWEVGNEAQGDSPLMVYCNDRTGQRIADCTNEFTFHSREEKKANARLISAAPEMLDALQVLLQVGILNPTGSKRVEEAIAAAKAAAAKAEGRAP